MYHIQIHISKQRCHVDLCTVCVAAGSDTVTLPNNIESNLTLTACFVDCIISAKAKKLRKDSLLSRKFSCVEDWRTYAFTKKMLFAIHRLYVSMHLWTTTL